MYCLRACVCVCVRVYDTTVAWVKIEQFQSELVTHESELKWEIMCAYACAMCLLEVYIHHKCIQSENHIYVRGIQPILQ